MDSDLTCAHCGKTFKAVASASTSETSCPNCAASSVDSPEADPGKPRLQPKAKVTAPSGPKPVRKFDNAISGDPNRALKKRVKRDLNSGMKKGRKILFAAALIFGAAAPCWHSWTSQRVNELEKRLVYAKNTMAAQEKIKSTELSLDLFVRIGLPVSVSLGVLCLVFASFFVWSLRATERACYAGLIAYLTAMAAGLVYAPILVVTTPALFIHAIMVVGLLTGLKSSRAYQKILDREAAVDEVS